MKKSSSITLTLMASMALVSCGQSRRCADPTGRVVPDSMCRGPVIIPGYHWIGGRSGWTSRSSSGVHGGTSTSDGVSRGGFGAHGEGSSAGHASASSGHASSGGAYGGGSAGS